MDAHRLAALAVACAALASLLAGVALWRRHAAARRSAQVLADALERRAAQAATASTASAGARPVRADSADSVHASATTPAKGLQRFIGRASEAGMHWLDTPLGRQVVAEEDRRVLEQCGFVDARARGLFLIARIGGAIVLPLVALVATTQTIVRARTSGLFELFLSQPCRREDWFRAVLLSRLLVILGPLVVLLVGTLCAGFVLGEQDLLPLILRSLLVAVSLVWAFTGVGLWLSARARSSERATVYALLAWLGTAALHDFGVIALLLRAKLLPSVVFVLAAANPSEAGRLALLSGIDPDLSVLGPVGFWIANALGPRLTLELGLAWPVAVGALATFLAARRFARSDLVG